MEGEAPGKKRERRMIIIILYNLSYYLMLSQNKSKCATATVLCTTEDNYMTPVHLIVFCSTQTKKLKMSTLNKEQQYIIHFLKQN